MPRTPTLALPLLVLAATGCADSILAADLAADQPMAQCQSDGDWTCLDCSDESCEIATLRLAPGDTAQLTYQVTGNGRYSGEYGIVADLNSLPFEDVELSQDAATLDETPVMVDLSFRLGLDACGGGFAGVRAESADDPELWTGTSVTISVLDVDGLVFCGE